MGCLLRVKLAKAVFALAIDASLTVLRTASVGAVCACGVGLAVAGGFAGAGGGVAVRAPFPFRFASWLFFETPDLLEVAMARTGYKQRDHIHTTETFLIDVVQMGYAPMRRTRTSIRTLDAPPECCARVRVRYGSAARDPALFSSSQRGRRIAITREGCGREEMSRR